MNFFDLHCDTAFEVFDRKIGFNSEDIAVRFDAAKNFENWVQTYAIWLKDDLESPYEKYKLILEKMKIELTKAPKNLTPIFAVEGGAVLETDIERVDLLAKDKIKLLTLTWNGENQLAGGIKSDKGLTDFGKRVIEKLNKLKIGCDLSHLNLKSFYKALEYSDYPIATHSNCFELCNHPRNLSLQEISMIAEKHGVIGLTFYPKFLSGNVMEAIYNNICFLFEKGFENNISIGSDFDGAKMSKNLEKTDDIPALYQYLQKKRLNSGLLNKVFYENAKNYIANLE